MRSPEFHVPHLFKIFFVWLSIGVVFVLVAYQIDKRASYWSRHVRNVMQPVAISTKPPIQSGLQSLFRENAHVSPDERPVIYHFWATWCAPCRAEIPTLNELQKRFSSKLKVVTIAVDENKDDILRFFGSSSPHFQVLWDQSQAVATQWGIEKYPETFLALPKNSQMVKFSGPRDWNSPEAIDYFSRVLTQPS